jgi:hypothetical protein
MANKHTKICSAFVIRGLQMKTSRIAKIKYKNPDNTICWQAYKANTVHGC